ncbi:MAG: hypothetical protein K2X86_17465 [Cytophagaceae bacterium]|nr:hypothetical protein [Cytophagaceae bacterium]
MDYTLQLFDQLIENYVEEESDEVKETIEAIKKTAYRLRTQEEIRLYIQNHQVVLLEQKNFDLLSQKCDKVLYFLETNFHPFVNEMLPISDIGKNKTFNCFNDLISEIETKIKDLDEKLYRYIQTLAEPESCRQCSIYYARYVSYFWESWLTDYSFSELKKETIVNFLISQNFNTPTFFKYITGEIIGELHQEDDPYFQEQVLLSHSKRFSTIPVKTENPFRRDYPDIKYLLKEWLKAEIKHCRKKLKSYNPQQRTILSKESECKIETSLSVAQMAYFFKLLNKSGVITNKVQMDILHVISERFRSQKTDTISIESLHNKYYNVEDRTKETVKKMLKEVLKDLE